MLALALLAIALYTIASRMLLFLYYPGIKKADNVIIKLWWSYPEKAPQRIRGLIEYARKEVPSLRALEGKFRELEAHFVPRVDRGLTILGVLVIAAPLFGLLGTVSGMLLTFKAISLGGSSVSEIVAKGISEALVATQTGLMIAIPGWMLASVIKRWRAEFVSFLLRVESIALRMYKDNKGALTQ